MLKNNLETLIKFFTIPIAILGIMWLIVEVVTQERTVALTTTGLTVFGYLAYLVINWKNGRWEDIPHSSDISNGNLTVRKVHIEAELRAVANLDVQEFGTDSIGLKTLRGWWKRYPKGVFVLQKEHKIIGAFGIYPVSKSIFDNITNGIIAEPDISPRNICQETEKQKLFQYWYVADIIYDNSVKIRFYDTPGRLLLVESVRLWLESCNLPAEGDIFICAIAASEDGAKILKKCGFTKDGDCKSNRNEKSINCAYHKKTNLTELTEFYQERKSELDKIRERNKRRLENSAMKRFIHRRRGSGVIKE
jgi:hypothetical protein